jgi:hypothetical protein
VLPTFVTSTLQSWPKPRERLKYAPDDDVRNPPEIAVVCRGQRAVLPVVCPTTLGMESVRTVPPSRMDRFRFSQ